MNRQIDLSNDEIKEILSDEYTRDNFDILVDHLLPDFTRNQEEMDSNKFTSCIELGVSKTLNLRIYEVMLPKQIENRRIEITQEMFRLLKRFGYENALVAFVNEDFQNYRLSLLTTEYKDSEDGAREKILSNPHRYSYRLGVGTKTKTVYEFLYAKGSVKSLEELKDRFSIDIVNKDFYSKIAESFTKLIGGNFSGAKYPRLLRFSQDVPVNKYSEFGVRLLGRLIFCWFLKEKKSDSGKPLVPDILFDDSLVDRPNGNYYNDILQTLFFETLNTPWEKRNKSVNNEYFESIPYLNGGLFSPHHDDFYDGIGSQNVYIPNSWFKELFDTLKQYNFTVDESTSYDVELSIDPEMLGRIFENLLAEINPETGESARHNTGSFYTPRDIVEFMVNTSLYEHLVNNTDVEPSKIETLIKYGDNEDVTFSNDERTKIVNALYGIKILDPACGSGAFPMGLLQKVVYILQEIDPDNILWLDKIEKDETIDEETKKQIQWSSIDYARKLLVIKNSIYGVDIQPIAAEISRLRCFLSIIIEEKIDDNLPNRGVRPLPNLDFKFAVGNTLIPLETGGKSGSLFDDYEQMEELSDIRSQWFTADANKKEVLKGRLEKLQYDMSLSASNSRDYVSEKYARLSKWNPYSSDENNWFDSEWMFGVDKFDIVIGNPPYIQLQNRCNSEDPTDTTKFGDLYKDFYYETFSRMGDIYCLFYEKGLNLLKHNGILTYITSNKWMRTGYGENLRGYLVHKNPILLVDFSKEKIFETATVDVNILVCQNSDNANKTHSCEASKECRSDLAGYIKNNCTECAFKSSDIWALSNSFEKNIQMKIEKNGIPLRDWGVLINIGILTGFNAAFIIDEHTKNRLITEDPKSADIIKPILRGRDIKRYGYDFSNKWLLAIHNGIKSKKIPRVDVNEYPAVKRYLDQYYEQLYIRDNQGDTPYNLRNCVYVDDFSKPKIMFSEIVQNSPQFYYDENAEFWPEATTFILTGNNLIPLVLMLNSNVTLSIFKKFYAGGVLGDKGVRYKKTYLESLPLPKPTAEESKMLNEYYSILKSGNDDKKKRVLDLVDDYLYKKYEFSDEEIDYIKSNKL